MIFGPNLKAKVLRQFQAGDDTSTVAAKCNLRIDWVEQVIRERLQEQEKTEEVQS